jgi:hypothetical protein
MAKRKEPTMKPINLIWVLALAGVAMACNSGPPVTNVKPPPTGGSGGTGGSAGTGGIGGGDGACTNEDDVAVYANLTYTDDDGNTFTGVEASAAIGSDCIFGTDNSDPLLEGCGDEAFAVVSCFPNCEPPVTQALADCVAQCTQDATGLSDECMACTGDTVACGAAFCTSQCVSDTNAPICIECRCDNGCTPEFDVCSGLPSSGDCG